MEIRRLPAEEDAVRRYAEELWLPSHRDLEVAVESHGLAEDVDLVAEEVAFRMDRLDSADYRAWVAIESGSDTATDGVPLAETDSELVGFVTTDRNEAPSVFDRPDRLVIGDIYVRDSHRGTGLAHELVDRAARRARETDCGELALDVDVDNECAVTFYEKLGFEPLRRRLRVDVEDL
ncbi:GNAT family N-acetyltransferase [Halobacteriales archaeon QS_5_68_33]|nr:MAG: GNAT family N-acetyltransferase [Halobacteriales archaeon QS_5_68_33]